MEAGDLLLAVNGEDVESCRHKEAQDTIVRSGNNIILTVRRGSALNQALKPPGRQTPLVSGNQAGAGAGAGAGEWNNVLQSNRAGAATNAEDFTQEFMSQLKGQTASNLPPPLLANHGNGQPNLSNGRQLNGQQNQPVRISTPTKNVSKD